MLGTATAKHRGFFMQGDYMNDINETMLSALTPWIPASDELEYAEYCQGEVESALCEQQEQNNYD